MNIATARSTIATALGGLGLHVYNWNRAAPQIPAAIVKVAPFPYHDTFGGAVDAMFLVQLLVGAVAEKGSQAKLDTLISTDTTGSAVDALETTGAIQVREHRNYQPVVLADGGTTYWSAELLVAVYGPE